MRVFLLPLCSLGLLLITPLADVARRAGHANPAITAAIYTHVVSENEREAAKIGDSLLSPAPGAAVEQITPAKRDAEQNSVHEGQEQGPSPL